MDSLFNKLTLKKELLVNLEELKYNVMTPIQDKGLPVVLEGRDLIAQAKTGSGKTAVFGLGILNSLDLTERREQALVLCPTRELAEQVAAEVRKLARKLKNVKVITLCGGVSEYHQEKSLTHGAQIIVGTPGRVLRLLNKKNLKLELVSTFVLDEADRMLDMGFHDDIMRITSFLPEERQTMLFSATYPDQIENLGSDILKDSIEVKVDVEHEASNIDEKFYEVERHQDKNQALLRVLTNYKPDRVIVFCKTKRITDDVANFLNDNGIFAESIHGDLEQNERTAVLTMFSNYSLSVLVATDVAARGLDIDDLAAVINYDLPTDSEVYIHRIGRTGRAGKTGLAFSFILQKNLYRIDDIEEQTKKECILDDYTTLSDSETYELIPPMKTMYIGGGKKNKLRPSDIVGAIIGEAGVSSDDIGNINIFNIVSYVAIKKDLIEEVITKLQTGKIKNRKFKVGYA